MKRIISMFLVVFLAMGVFSGCKRSQEDKSGKKKIAVLITDMTATYAAWLTQSFKEYAKQYPDYELTYMDCKYNVATQMANLENAVAQQYDMVINHSVDPTAIAHQLNQTIDAGIPVLVVNGRNVNAERASCVDADPVEQGAIPAKYALKHLRKNAKVVVLLGPSGNFHSIGRRKGYQQALFDKRPDITILEEKIADWYKDKGMALMEDWLQKHPKIDAVLSMNDAMALGAIEACKAAKRMKGMQFYGVDGLGDACLSIAAGELTLTCVQNADEQAKMALEISDKVLKGEIDHKTYMTPGILVTKANVKEWIVVHKKNGQIK